MRPANLVVIMSDEHHPRAMGVAGHPFAVTPNLDRLAARGTRFDAAYCNSPDLRALARLIRHRPLRARARHLGQRHRLRRHACRAGAMPCSEAAIASIRSASCTTATPRTRPASTTSIIPMHIYGGHGMVWGALRDGKADFTERAHVMLDPIGPGTSKYNIYDDRIASEAEDLDRASGRQRSMTAHGCCSSASSRRTFR